MNALKPLIAAALLAAIAHGGETAVSSISFSDPTQPGTLSVFVAQGRVTVRGEPESSTGVTVRSNVAPAPSPGFRADGLRVVSAAASFSLTEKGNVISLEYGRQTAPTGSGSTFEISVPPSTHVVVNTAWAGEVTIENVLGDVEVKNLNGPIALKGLGGGALVESMNGSIDASFARLTPEKPVSFTSMNGEVLLRLPDTATANVRFRTQNGSVLTDFTEDVFKTKSEPLSTPFSDSRRELSRVAADAARAAAEAARAVATEVRIAVQEAARERERPAGVAPPAAPRAPRPPQIPPIPAIAGGKVVSGTLNGGGPEIQIATMNGDIIIRKLN